MKIAGRLRVVELYAGMARSAEPFRRWHRCQLSLLIDNNPFARDTYLLNHRKAPYLVANVANLSADDIESQAGGRVHVLLGCAPCQGFSENGRRRRDDWRNRHLYHFGRLAEELRPYAIAMENVPLAAATNRFRRFTRRIEQSGYHWTAGIINAALRGSVQCRQRLVFVAIRRDVGPEPVFPHPTHGGHGTYFSYRFREMRRISCDRDSMLGIPSSVYTLRPILPYWEGSEGDSKIPCIGDTLDDLPKLGTSGAAAMAHIPWAHTRSQLSRMARVPEGGRWEGGRDHYSQAYGRLHRNGLARTITTAFPNAGSGRFWHPCENRSLTMREAARIQGFPDSFKFAPPYSRAAFLVGNALDASLAKLTFDMIRSHLE